MAFEITITPGVRRQMGTLTARERNTLRTAMADRLRHQPTSPTSATKRLRPNPTAAYELRVGDLRALYDVEASEVLIKVVGRKVGNQLIVEGEVFDGLRDDSAEPPGTQPPDDPR